MKFSDSSRSNPQGLTKRSICIAGHRTSLSLETAFWDELKKCADARHIALSKLVAQIDAARTGNLSSALRLFILNELKGKLENR